MRSILFLALSFLSAICAAATPDWVARSNAIVDPIIDARSRFVPEQASFRGKDAFDTQVIDLAPDLYERRRAQTRSQIEALRKTLESEADARVKQDLEIVIGALEREEAYREADHQHLFDYVDASEIASGGLKVLLDPRNKPERQQRALVRLRRYAGLEAGYEPMAAVARRLVEASMARPGLQGPFVEKVKQNIANTDILIKGVAELFARDGIRAWEEDFEVLAAQLREYRDWQQRVVLPRARTQVMLPPAVYAAGMRQLGVDMAPDEIVDRAGAEFQEVRGQMEILAAQVAKSHGWPSSRYPDVIRKLKERKLAPDAMLELYRARLKEIEGIIRRDRIVTLPQRDMVIRASTPSEAAQTPAPNLRPPRLVGNTGEQGEFLIPLENPHAKSGAPMDDFSFEAASWIVTAHEARPGHELQFARMVEQGVSLARAVFAFNSANTEGWGLYCETLIFPYEPPEARLIALQFHMLRLARAMLDPMLNLGRISPERAKQVLLEDVAVSEPFAQQEVDRYTFGAPGQATSYYYGFQKLRSLRTQTEIALGSRFEAQAFHDFIMSQGMLPPDVLGRAVMEQFVPSRAKRRD